MNDKIKEYPKEQQKLKDYLDNVTIEQIIDKLKDDDGMTWWVDYQDQYQPNWKKLYVKEVQLLLDYMTNLHQRNIELMVERDRLKELCNAYEEEHSTEFKIWKDERQQLREYKSRNEKAIEFNQIVLNSDYVYLQDEIAQKNLIILQGEDKDVKD